MRDALALSVLPGLGVVTGAPAAEEPGVTASASWERCWSGGFVAALLASGRNDLPEGLSERVDRDVYELTNKTQRPEDVPPDETKVDALGLGYSYTLPLLQEAGSAAGAMVGLHRFDAALDPVYGDSPVSFRAYLRFRFGSRQGHEHHH